MSESLNKHMRAEIRQNKVAFFTLGCKTNHYETDAMKIQFESAGFEIVSFRSRADVYVINTCTVTAEADRKSRQMLRRARHLNPDALVVAAGCQTAVRDLTAWANLTLSNDQKKEAVEQVCGRISKDRLSKPFNRPREKYGAIQTYAELGPVDRQSETRAYIKIEDGCDQRCSYCVIPHVRGPVRSREQTAILAEARLLADHGYREIVLTGIHLCSYGTDRGLPSHAVMELALDLANIKGIERIRLGSLDPSSVTKEFITLAAKNSRLCPHFHLSLQSGSDRILKKMNRRYLTKDFRQVVCQLRERFDDPGLTTDVIVGFPGETDDDFNQSLAFCREIGFSRTHVFRFSARDGTPAARLPGPVLPHVSSDRSRQMMSAAQACAKQYHQRQVGRLNRVLIEQKNPDGLFEGYTETYVPVHVMMNKLVTPGSIIETRGVHAEADYLICKQT
jgi:threonylcarbamoyladenosine tRNA methylthiotransferase MtaB